MKRKNILERIAYIILIALIIVIFVIGNVKDKKILQVNAALADKYFKEQKTEQERLQNLTFYEKMKEHRSVSVLILGDETALSLGKDSDDGIWSTKLQNYLKKKYNSEVTININAYAGNNAFLTCIDGYQQDLKKYDAVLLLLGQNDINNEKNEQFQILYENLIKNLIKGNQKIEILPVIAGTIKKNNEYSDTIMELSKYYNIQDIDIRQEFLVSKEASKNLTNDGTLPNNKGYDIYFNSIKDIIDGNVSSEKKIKYNIADNQTLYKDTVKVSSASINKDTEKNTGFVNTNGVLVSKNAGDYLTYKINSNMAGVIYMTQKNGGNFRLLVDKKPVRIISTKGDTEEKTCYVINDNLNLKDHEVTIEVQKGTSTAVKIIGIGEIK